MKTRQVRLGVSVLLLCAAGCEPAMPEGEQSSDGESATPTAVTSDPSSLRITFLGTGSPRPSFLRYGPSTLVEAGEQRLLIDPSWGLRERLLQVGSFDLITGVEHVLLTHLHFDHTLGLPDLWLTGWLYGRRVPLRVQGPVGTAEMMAHFQRAYRWDVDFRITVGVPAAGSGIEALDVAPGVIYERDGLRITAFEVEHLPIDLTSREPLDFEGASYGYRIDYGEHSVVFSGDTRPSDNLVRHAQGVDVLVHEVQVPSPGASGEAKLANVSLSVHSDPGQVGGIFSRVQPRLAVYSHIIPPEVTPIELAAATPYDGPMIVARDLMMIIVGDSIQVMDRPLADTERFEESRVLR